MKKVICEKCGKKATQMIDETTGNTCWVCHNCKEFICWDCEVYSRVVGYLRPTNQWNEGKQAEYKDRKTFNEKELF